MSEHPKVEQDHLMFEALRLQLFVF